MLHGKTIKKDSDEGTYIGECFDFKAHGFGEKRWPDGDLYVGSWKND